MKYKRHLSGCLSALIITLAPNISWSDQCCVTKDCTAWGATPTSQGGGGCPLTAVGCSSEVSTEGCPQPQYHYNCQCGS